MTPEQIQALVERAEECPCACQIVDVEREQGWEWTDPTEGDRHTLTGCTYPGLGEVQSPSEQIVAAVRAVLDTSQTDIAAELEAQIREVLDS